MLMAFFDNSRRVLALGKELVDMLSWHLFFSFFRMSGTAGYVTWTCYHSGNLLLLFVCISSPSSVDSLYLHEEGFYEEALRSLLQKPSLRSLSLQSVCDDKEMQSTRDRCPRPPLRDAQGQEMHILLLREPEQNSGFTVF